MSKNLKIVQGIYDGFASGDIQAVLGLLPPEFEIHEPSSLPFGGVYRGPDGLLQLLGKIGESVSGVEIKLERLIAEGDEVVAFSHFSGVPNGSTERSGTPLLERWVFRDGRLAELWPHYYDVTALRRA